MKRHHALLCVLLATLLCLAVQLPTVRADIVISGDVGPADPDDWNSSAYGFVGNSGYGTLTVDSDSDLFSYHGTIGSSSGSTGVVTVAGTGSTWTNGYIINVGQSGSGTLNITGGGAVSSNPGLSGEYMACAIGQSGSSMGVVMIDGAGSNWTNTGSLAVGYSGTGMLHVTNGGTMNNGHGVIGYDPGSLGNVTVDGTDSKWINSGYLGVGVSSGGNMNITGGGSVSNSWGSIGLYSGSIGVVTVDGIGSTWTNSSNLSVGSSGNGMLNIIGGGTVTAANVSINSQSLLAIDVGNGSLLNINSGSGEIENDGTVRILAGAGATTENVYSPISAGIWEGDGIYQAVGGTWNESSHEFTVSGVQSGTSGTTATIDLASTQRLLIADGGEGHTGWSLGASFLHKTGENTDLDFTATVITGETLDGLVALLDSGESVKGAWEFIVAGDGYTSGDPAYLSFDIGEGYSRGDLQVWHFDGTDWTDFDASDLTCNGDYASFTVTGFSGYAVSVPEPGTLVLLIAAALGLLAWVRKTSSF